MLEFLEFLCVGYFSIGLIYTGVIMTFVESDDMAKRAAATLLSKGYPLIANNILNKGIYYSVLWLMTLIIFMVIWPGSLKHVVEGYKRGSKEKKK